MFCIPVICICNFNKLKEMKQEEKGARKEKVFPSPVAVYYIYRPSHFSVLGSRFGIRH